MLLEFHALQGSDRLELPRKWLEEGTDGGIKLNRSFAL